MIHIKDDYYIYPDEYQFMLIRLTGKVDKDGKPVKEYISYHRTFPQAVRAYLRRQERIIGNQQDMELTEALRLYEGLVRDMMDFLQSKSEVRDG